MINKVAFYGPMCSGKTFCANILQKEYSYYKVSFATELKWLSHRLFGVQEKTAQTRLIYQQVAQKMREIDPDVWINFLLTIVEQVKETTGTQNFVLDDLRYMNEAYVLESNGWTLVRVDVPDLIRSDRITRLYPETSSEAINHVSEREWEDIFPHAIVDSFDETVSEQLGKIIEMPDRY